MKPIKLQNIIEEVAKEFKVDPVAILTVGSSSRNVSTARYVCAFLLKDCLPKTKVASLLGRRNDQYVYSAVNRVIDRSQTDHEFYLRVLKIGEKFGLGFQ
jgi:chromosomal replication initiation ATPase DnaA